MKTRKTGRVSADISNRQILAFGAVVWPLVIGQQSLSFMLPYYSQVIGLPLTAISGLLVIARVFDTFWDTGIAYISDNTRSRFGRRKPWIVAGLILFVPAIWLLFVPGPSSSVTGYGVILFFYFTAWTMAYIPILSQASELSQDYGKSNSIAQTQSVVTISSLLVGSLMPFFLLDQRTRGLRLWLADQFNALGSLGLRGLLDFLKMPTITGPERYGPIMLVIVVTTSLVLPMTLAAYMFNIREKPVSAHAPKGSITAAIKNVVFRRFFLGYGLMMLGYMGRQGLLPFIVTFALHATDNLLFLMILTSVTGIVCTPLWSAMLRRFERSTVVIAAALVEAVGLIMLACCGPNSGLLIAASFVVLGVPGLTIMLAPYQIAGDCADYAKWKTGKESRAVHVSLISLTKKFGSIWAAASVALAGLLGFNPKLAGPAAHTIIMLKALGLIAPAGALLLGAVVVVGFPMTERRQRALKLRIARREGAEASRAAEDFPIRALTPATAPI